jgi:hypothetical protein
MSVPDPRFKLTYYRRLTLAQLALGSLVGRVRADEKCNGGARATIFPAIRMLNYGLKDYEVKPEAAAR